MQWSAGKNRGFSTADPQRLYLPVDTSKDAPNVATQEGIPNSLLNKVRSLIHLRKTTRALWASSEFVPVYAQKNSYPFIYARAFGEETVLVILNPADRKAAAQFSLKPHYSGYKLLAGCESELVLNENICRVAIQGRSYSIYRLDK